MSMRCPFSYYQDPANHTRLDFFPTLEECVGYATITADRTLPVFVEQTLSYYSRETVVYDWDARNQLQPRVENKANRREFLPKSQRQ